SRDRAAALVVIDVHPAIRRHGRTRARVRACCGATVRTLSADQLKFIVFDRALFSRMSRTGIDSEAVGGYATQTPPTWDSGTTTSRWRRSLANARALCTIAQ